LALVYCTQALLQRFGKKSELFIALTVVVIFLNFIYFLPIYIGDVMTYDAWRARMWFPSWI
jgi:dolichyl-phosphate-mannose--protein O-mannosyl transferase